MSAWVPIVTAIVSLIISLYTFVVTTDDPDVRLILPEVVRIAQGGADGPYLYIEPIFIGAGLSDRIEVITDVHIRVEPANQLGGGVEFTWDEQGAWVFDANTQSLSWAFTGDAGAFLVSAKSAQQFTGLFIGPADWLFAPGRYRITLVADRATTRVPLSRSFEVDLLQEDIEFLNQSEGTRFLTFSVLE